MLGLKTDVSSPVWVQITILYTSFKLISSLRLS